MSTPLPKPAKRSRWLALGGEALLIIFSVLLALVLDEMRQDVADRKLVARVQGTIQDELARNRAILAGRLPYHEVMYDSTRKFLGSHRIDGKDGSSLRQFGPQDIGFDTSKGLATAGTFGRTGWELALNSGALEHMDYDRMVVFSETYAKQDEVEKQEEELLQQVNLVQAAYFGEGNLGNALLSFSAALTDMVLRERELLADYDRALAGRQAARPGRPAPPG